MVRPLRTLTGVLTIMIAIGAIWTPLVLGAAQVAPTLYLAEIAPIADAVDAAQVLLFIATAAVFATWIHRAGTNLLAADLDALEFTPWSRVWWFFVPFANLVKPFQGMRELWNASHGIWPYDTGEAVVTAWWVLWLGSRIIANLGMRLELPYLIWIGAILGIGLAAVAIRMIHAIARAQSHLNGRSYAEVFA